jgi:putative membrane protein
MRPTLTAKKSRVEHEMKRALLVAGVCVLLTAPAFAQTQHTPPAQAQQPAPQRPQTAPQNAAPSPNANNSVNANSGAASASTADFVKNAAIAGLFEIQSSELALRKRESQDRRFAKRMIHDHERASQQLKHIVRADHINAQVPTQLDDQHQKMLQQLRGESGQTFEKDYDKMQLQGHQEAVSLFQNYAQNGDNQALKRWAQRTLPTLQDHLSMAQKLPS